MWLFFVIYCVEMMGAFLISYELGAAPSFDPNLAIFQYLFCGSMCPALGQQMVISVASPTLHPTIMDMQNGHFLRRKGSFWRDPFSGGKVKDK